MTILLLMATGIATGIFTGLLGCSSGAIMVPLLIIAFQTLAPAYSDSFTHLAIGTTLAVSIISATVALAANWRYIHYNSKIFWTITIGTVISFPIVTYLSSILSGPWLQLIFACLVLSLPLLVIQKQHPAYPVLSQPIILTLASAVAGTLGVVSGLGGGPFTIAFYKRAGFALKTIIANLPYTGVLLLTLSAGIYVYIGWGKPVPPYSAGYVYLPALVFVGIPNAISTLVIAKLRHNMNQTYVLLSYVIILLLVGLGMLASALSSLGFW